jgi:SAM-dependent methyltransferase
MLNFSLIDVLKNILILVPYIKSKAKLMHKTGIMDNTEKALSRAAELTSVMKDNSVDEGRVVEFGPGKTGDTIIELSKNEKISRAFVVDTERYFPDDFWLNNGIDFLYKDSSMIRSDSIDLVYCYDVLEHVRRPMSFLREIKRIIKGNGVFFISWDLRDHLNINDEKKWFDMHKYNKTIWNLQMSNRSSYVNRLLFSEWIKIFENSGFTVSIVEILSSNIAQSGYYESTVCKIDPIYRAKVILYSK